MEKRRVLVMEKGRGCGGGGGGGESSRGELKKGGGWARIA